MTWQCPRCMVTHTDPEDWAAQFQGGGPKTRSLNYWKTGPRFVCEQVGCSVVYQERTPWEGQHTTLVCKPPKTEPSPAMEEYRRRYKKDFPDELD